MPNIDRDKEQYIVVPRIGLVMPVNAIDKNSKVAQSFLNGNNENFWKELKFGSIELPGNSNNYGEYGNKVIAGHSSYWKKAWARYKTHFQRIIEMEE